MQLDRVRLKEVGIDYITATSHQRTNASPLFAFGAWLVSEEVAQGCVRGNYRAQGYRGFIAGRAAVGLSQQGTICRLSAKVAANHFEQLLNLADNVTRLDVQATLLPGVLPPEALLQHHKELLRAQRGRGKPAQFAMRYGPHGPESCSLGNRLSDRYGRVYDKGKESGEPEYAGCLRYELELHREQALRYAQRFDATDSQEADMLALLNSFFKSRGLRSSPLEGFAAAARLCSCPAAIVDAIPDPLVRPPTINRSIRYLERSIKPLVARLLAAGLHDEVYEALGLPAVTKMSPEPWEPPADVVFRKDEEQVC